MDTMTTRLGAYEILRKTLLFPTSFWAVYEDEKGVVIEIANDGTQRVRGEVLDQAVERGDIIQVIELPL